MKSGFDSYGSEQGPVVDACEHGNEYSGFINGREFLDQDQLSQLIKDDSTT
jgi:hypothetical protein